MKATGIVRRIDDLGRIVIPKEIRRTLHIRESDPLEIFTDREGQVILIHINDRICQFRIMENQPKIVFDEVAHLEHEDRGGHGSTGKQ